MAIPKLPTSNERKIQGFIAQANKPPTENDPYPITLRLSRDFLNHIDAAAKRRRITRSAWIKSALSKALEELENNP
jgi:uncharacterized protein (DUF1778 family)